MPTYTAMEVRQMCAKMDMSIEAFRILAKLIDEEIELYEDEDLIIVAQASFMLFTRSLLMGSIKNLK